MARTYYHTSSTGASSTTSTSAVTKATLTFTPSIEASAYETSSGLYGKRYVGYFNDDVTFFDTAALHGDTNTTTQISGFSSSADGYSWMWVGVFKASATGTWTFYTSSDDASYLWIGPTAITGYTTANALVNNGGLHADTEVSATISLTAGQYYPIRIMFGENTGGENMTVSFAGPGVSKTTNGSGYYYDGLAAWDSWIDGNSLFQIKRYAIFMSALIGNLNTADRTLAGIYDVTNGTYITATALEPRDTTDEFSATGFGIFTATSNTSRTFRLEYFTDSGGTATIQDAYLTALELVDTDAVSYTNGVTTINAGSNGADGDDVYQTLNQITLSAGSYVIVGSAIHTHSALAASSVARARVLIWDDTNNTAYGYTDGTYVRETSSIYPYWYVMAVAPGSTTNYDLRVGRDYGSSMVVYQRGILALDRTAFRQVYSAHRENPTSTTSSTDQVADSITVTLDNSGNNLILASWWGSYSDTAQSWLSNIQLNGTDIYTADISVEPNDGTTTPIDGTTGSIWSNGFAGVQNMSSGSNTLRVVWRAEGAGDVAGIGRVNITGFDLDNGLGFSWYVKNGGAWKEAQSFNVKHAGTWKAATGLYVKKGGVWKSLINTPEFTGENVDAASSSYTNIFPNPPPPPPPPPPTPPPPPPTCLSLDTLITMWDGTKKAVQDIVIGDMLKTLTGVQGRVVRIEKPLLSPARRMIRMYHEDMTYLRISDDHDMWVNENGIEQWGTYNYNWWLYEARLAGEDHVPALPLIPFKNYKFGTSYGWVETQCQWEHEQDPNEVIYNIIIDQGGGFIANDFVVISEGCSNEDIANMKWNGLK